MCKSRQQMVNTIYLVVAMVVTTNGLTITNVTSPVLLTPIVSKGYEKTTAITGGLMTNFKTSGSQDPSVFYLMSFDSNDSVIEGHVVGDVFDSSFSESTNINNLPLDIDDQIYNHTDPYSYGALYANGICTSPVTGDIITCWINITTGFERVHYQIGCRIYFVATNTFSDVIAVTNTTRGQNVNNAQNGVVCFDDSYFIPYGYSNVRFTETDIIYATILDLKGNIRYKEVELKNVSIPRNDLQLVYATKGSKQFSTKNVNPAATDLVAVTFQLFNLTDNTTRTNGLYGYYTNINDTKFPITIYNDTIIQRATDVKFNGEAFIQPVAGITTDVSSDCCYLFGYEVYHFSGQTGDVDDVYMMITDIYGNYIDIAGFSKDEDIRIISNVSDYNFVSLVDLPMISSETARYFMLSYSNNTEYDEANVTSARIFYLEKAGEYTLNTAGDYDIFEVQGNYPDSDYPGIGQVFIYNPPDTSLLLYTWIQDQQIVINDTFTNPEQIYGQTFLIL